MAQLQHNPDTMQVSNNRWTVYTIVVWLVIMQ